MIGTSFNEGWQVRPKVNPFAELSGQTIPFEPVTLPHDAVIGQHPYNLLLVGHAHSFSHYQHQVTVGNGGAPISGSTPFGFATVELLPGLGFRISQYDYATGLPINTFMIY